MYRTEIEQNWEDYVSLWKEQLRFPVSKAKPKLVPFWSRATSSFSLCHGKAQSYGLEIQIVKDAMGYAQLGKVRIILE